MSIIVSPIVSEKATSISEKLNRYSFKVEKTANKLDIKNAVEKYYGVTVEAVNTVRYQGKIKTRNTTKGLAVGRTNSYKKAIVTLKQGDVIDLFGNV